jgi:hypothetical protein
MLVCFPYNYVFEIFKGHLVNFMGIWYILWSFSIFFTVLVCCTKKNLATLFDSRVPMQKCKLSRRFFVIKNHRVTHNPRI